MSWNFFPRVVHFFELFKKQNDILTDTAQVLYDLFNDYSHISEKCSKIVRNEYAGNDISLEIARELSLTFITPLDREDIHAINMAQENALNAMRAISTRIGFYHFDRITPGAKDLVYKLKLMTGFISEMLEELKHRKDVEIQAGKVKETKIEADMLLLLLLGENYERVNENTKDLLEIIKWSHIYDRIEEAVAATETLSNVIEGISLKNV